MKKYTSAAIITMLISLLASCHSSNKTGNTSDADGSIEVLVFDSAAWTDTVAFSKESMATVSVRYYYAAEGGKALCDSINQWVITTITDTTFTFTPAIDELAAAWGKHRLQNDSTELAELIADDAPDYVCYSYDCNIKPLYEDSLYVTMQIELYEYFGGAHGSFYTCGTTFRKTDGHIMGFELIKDMEQDDVIKQIKHGLLGYFDCKNEDEMIDMLLIGDIFDDASKRDAYDHDFPLPATPPYLTSDGICLIYQQYEIAPYAGGMPTVTIPLKK